MYGSYFLVILFFFGLATGIVGKIKGSSFFLWFAIGAVLPIGGLIAALLYRWERHEPRMRCPQCGKVLPISDQVCTRCGEDIVWEERHSPGDDESRVNRVWAAKNRCYTPRPGRAGLASSFFPTICGGFCGTQRPAGDTRASRKEVAQMRAVDAMMECLKAEGVEAVFGIPGGANLPTYDALYDAGIRNVLCRHEQGAGHAAEGYAKATGKVGVALATSGPGATNLVTAIADAVMDSVPTVFITGQVRTELMGTDGFQEADTIGITMPIVKHSFQVLRSARAPALDDPRGVPPGAQPAGPGPVLVDIPQDLSRADIPYDPSEAAQVELPGYKNFDEGNVKQIRLAAKALANARRPIIYAGGGVINGNASEELREFVTHRSLPDHLHRDGPRRLPGASRAVARHARHARDAHGQLRDGQRRPDRRRRRRASTTASRASCRSSRRGRSSSTSTSTRPRSRRTCPRTSRSSATASGSCRS